MPRGGRGSARRRWGAAGLLGLALGGAQGAPGAPDPGGAPGGPSLAAFGAHCALPPPHPQVTLLRSHSAPEGQPGP